MKLNPKQTFLVFATLMVSFLIVAVWLATRSIGRVEMVQKAADELEVRNVRNVRIGARIRVQVHRLSSTMLRYQVSGAATYRERFELYKEELDNFLTTNAKILDTENEKRLLSQLQQQLQDYYAGASRLMEARQTADLPAAQMEQIKSGLDRCVELSLQLGDSRKAIFRESLAVYGTATRKLERLIMISLGLLGIASSLLGWLAYRAYLAPVKGALVDAKSRADRHERLASVGVLAAGIAHEIRNPLTAIKARLFALKELAGADSPATNQAVVIDGELNRMERLLKNFLDYARPSNPEFEDTNVRAFLSEVSALLAPDLESKNVSLRMEVEEELEAKFDRQQLKQVMLNLIKNAHEVCPDDGQPEIVLSAQRVDNRVELSVHDNGPGIPEAYQSEIFTPFFSKKHGGTGLGLPICRNIIRKHGADLKFETGDTIGTRFYFSLTEIQPTS
jgi:signal transduction histidine kinase